MVREKLQSQYKLKLKCYMLSEFDNENVINTKIKSETRFLKWSDSNDNAYVHCNFHSLSLNTIG